MSSNSLTQMIEQLVLEKTVSLDALNSINALKVKAQQLEEQLIECGERYERDQEIIKDLNQKIQVKELLCATQNTELKTKDAAIEQMRNDSLVGKMATAELKGFTGAMEMVFKPAAVRESIQRNVAVPVHGGGTYAGFVAQHAESETVTRTQE